MLTSLRRILGKGTQPKRGAYPFSNGTKQMRSSAVLIHVPTSDGSGEACHPSVRESEQMLGGYRYWMANTPYPGNSHKLENPEIYASNDGLFWQVPSGVSNPIVPPPPGDDRTYNSDPCLLIHGGEFWLYFRSTDEEPPRHDHINLVRSRDAISWTDPVTVIADRSGAMLLSPSVVFTGDLFLMWTVDRSPNEAALRLTWRASQNGYEWTKGQPCQIEWPDVEMEPWHIDVCQVGGGFEMIMSARRPGLSGTQRWYRAKGLGRLWHAEVADEMAVCGFESGKPYKASLLPPTAERPHEWIYTSSRSADGRWFTALRSFPGHPAP